MPVHKISMESVKGIRKKEVFRYIDRERVG